ncbi:MAG: LysR family transcriptional regulator [Oscillochloridaceae bacterium umkhey_bin13]
MLNTFYLRTFVTVVETGSFSAAAAKLHMSQPAVSQQIRGLEEQLGEIKLFRRVGKRMVPTHAGEELLARARDLVQQAERTYEHMRALKGEVGGRVSFGCSANSAERLLPHLLVGYQARFPEVRVELVLAGVEGLIDGLNERRLALALIEEQQRRRGFEHLPLGTEPVVLVAASGNPLLKQEQVPPGVLREQSIALPRSGTPLRRVIEDGLRRRGIALSDLRPVLETDSTTALIQAAQTGLGLSFVPRSCLPARHEGLGIVDLAGPPLQQEWFLVRLRERGIPGAAQSLAEYLLGPQARLILSRAGIVLH